MRYVSGKLLPRAVCAAAALLILVTAGCGAKGTYTVIDASEMTETKDVSARTVEGECLVYTEKGDVFRAEDYKVREALIGVISNPPERTVMDAALQAEKWLDAGERVMIIYIDGLGWETFAHAASDGAVPNLGKLSAEICASVYPTITPVNYAAMVTGRPPSENGVTKRGIHAVECDTVFTYASSLGLTSYVSEGDIQILALPDAELELSPDLNGSGTGDDEIFERAMEHMGSCDLMLVHFHSVDDSSHEYSPVSDEVRDALVMADGWCGELLSAWDGRVIITSDHGQHVQDGTGDTAYADRKGTHGDFAVSDIFVPYITR